MQVVITLSKAVKQHAYVLLWNLELDRVGLEYFHEMRRRSG